MIKDKENVECEQGNCCQPDSSTEIEQLVSCQKELKEWKDKYLLLYADFENFKRRTYKEQIQLTESAQTKLLLSILPIVDNFERALNSIPLDSTIKNWSSGIELIYQSLQKSLASFGVKPIEQNESFDPALHEAINQVTDAQKPSGAIVQVYEKGYFLGDKVLRPAKVAVAQ